jgi:hypothetical protein
VSRPGFRPQLGIIRPHEVMVDPNAVERIAFEIVPVESEDIDFRTVPEPAAQKT